MRASEIDTETMVGSLPTAAAYLNYALNKFTSYPDLKPKYLEKEENLIEVNTWIGQVGYYIRAVSRLQTQSSTERRLYASQPSTSSDMDFSSRLQKSQRKESRRTNRNDKGQG